MSVTTYVYTKQVNPVTLKDTIDANSTIVIGVNNIQINSDNSTVSAIMKDSLPTAQEAVLSGLVDTHVYTAPVIEEAYDREGKLIVHQSIRPNGTHTYFTGAGDDPDVITDVGNGTHMHVWHEIGDALSGSLYADWNLANNKSYIYEGYISWEGCKITELTAEVVASTVTYNTVSGGTNYDMYGGYLVIPSANGTMQLTSDITKMHGGLVYMPEGSDGIRPTAYWDATWSETSGVYYNIAANTAGKGEYNMFAVEVPLTKFVNKYILTGRGTQELDSEDAEEIGQGMRLKLTYNQNTTVADTEWFFGVTVTMHRSKTV